MADNLVVDTAAGGTATIATKDVGGVHTALYRLQDNNGKTVNHFKVDQSAAGNTVVAAASPGNKHKVVGGVISLTAAGTIIFNTAATALTGAMPLAANGGFVWPIYPEAVLFETNTNESLNFTTTGGFARGFLRFITEP